MLERAITFECAGQTLVGILHPAAAGSRVGVVVVVGGPQYRAGSHRQFVSLARAAAGAGFAALRFDARGMGDSSGEPITFEQAEPDIGAAIDALIAHQPTVEQVVLWGLCDAASAILMYVEGKADRRVAGLCLLNPYVRSDQSLAKTRVRHYYLQRLRDRAFWRKLLSGGVGLEAARGLAADAARSIKGAAQEPSFRIRMWRGWGAFAGPILLVLSGDDLTAREFEDTLRDDADWARALAGRKPLTLRVDGADHTFSDRHLLDTLEARTIEWLRTVAARLPEPESSRC